MQERKRRITGAKAWSDTHESIDASRSIMSGVEIQGNSFLTAPVFWIRQHRVCSVMLATQGLVAVIPEQTGFSSPGSLSRTIFTAQLLLSDQTGWAALATGTFSWSHPLTNSKCCALPLAPLRSYWIREESERHLPPTHYCMEAVSSGYHRY